MYICGCVSSLINDLDPLVLVPSLFFISGQTGLPLEVLGGPLTKENIKQKLTSLVPEENQVWYYITQTKTQTQKQTEILGDRDRS